MCVTGAVAHGQQLTMLIGCCVVDHIVPKFVVCTSAMVLRDGVSILWSTIGVTGSLRCKLLGMMSFTWFTTVVVANCIVVMVSHMYPTWVGLC